jgi:hypothetical protein
MTDLATPVAPCAVELAPTATVSRWRRALTSEWTRTFALVLAWHAVLTAIAILFQGSYPTGPGSPSYSGGPVSGIAPGPTLLSHTFRWDSEHFNGILNGGYTNPATRWTAAFYPFFPICVWLVQAVTFGKLGVLAAGFVVNVIASWLAATALLKITRFFLTSTWAPWLAVAAFLTAPPAFVMHSFYSEAVFCALGFWAYLFAIRRQWAWMGLCLIPLTATRVTAVLFVGLCLLEFFRAKQWRLRALLTWNLLWFPAAYLGFASYALYLKLATGDALGMLHAYKTQPAWGYHVLNINFLETIGKEAETSIGFIAQGGVDVYALISHVLPMIGLVTLLAVSCYVFYKLRGPAVPLAVFGLASIVMLTLNSNVISVHRYLLPCLVIYIAIAAAAERSTRLKPVMYGVLYAHTMVQGLIFSLFIAGSWSV